MVTFSPGTDPCVRAAQMMTVEGATDAEVFETFLERVLLRKLKPIVVLDNVGAHKTADVRRLIRAAGARVLSCRRTRPT